MKKNYLFFLFFLIILSSFAYAQTAPQAAYCNIQYLDIADDLTLGRSDGALMLRVQQERTNYDNVTWNYTINHASCYMNIIKGSIAEQGTYDIISTEPYENILPHGLRYSSTAGVLNFLMDMDEEFWQPRTNYTWQVYCYCLDYNLTNGAQDQHDCWYDIVPFLGISNFTGYPVTNTLGCIQSGSFITGDDYRTSPDDDGQSLAIAFFILLLTGVLFFFPFIMDYLRKPISENAYLNLMIRRLCYLLATFLMIQNSTIMANIAISAGLMNVINDMWLYLKLFSIAGYILIFYIAFATIRDLLGVWIEESKGKRGFT